MADDDDIDDLVDELRETNRNLSRLVDAIVRGQEAAQDEGPEDAEYPVDLVTEGRYSPNVTGIVEYEQNRMSAANSDSATKPRYTGDRDRVEFYVNAFTSSIENTDQIRKALSKDEFDGFIQGVAVYHGVDEELVDILEPSAGFFGFDVNEAGEVIFIPQNSHIVLLEAMGSYWNVDPDTNLEPERITRPWNSLQVGTMQQLDNINRDFVVEPDQFLRFDPTVQPVDKNIEMAQVIEKRNSLDLPEHLRAKYLA